MPVFSLPNYHLMCQCVYVIHGDCVYVCLCSEQVDTLAQLQPDKTYVACGMERFKPARYGN